VLNRLFIAIGLVAIIVIAAAFVVPSFIPWGEYRERLAGLAGEVLGAPVRIDGDISFTLLPNPKLQFAGVSSGPEAAPTLSVERVEAEFSLIDFLRDRYNVTRLLLDRPVVRIDVDADGRLASGLALARGRQSNVSVASAIVSDGLVTLTDARTGTTYEGANVDGELRIEALSGPYSFQGNGAFDGRTYAVRVATGAQEAGVTPTLSLSVQPADSRFTLSADGVLSTGDAPAFEGTMTWRQPPVRAVGDAPVDAGQGDLVMTSKVAATTSRVLLTDYIVVPDENRGATRLQGAAEISLGRSVAFNAVISGGVLALPPRDATAEQAVEPYEIVRLLRELPLPAAPGIPGTIGMDIAEVDLRAFALRNVRLDARTSEGGWAISRLTGTLPGDTTVTLAGDVDTSTGKPEFSGSLALRSLRLDALSTLWRELAEGNPLFSMPGRIEARLNLVGDTLSVSDASLDLDGQAIPFSAQLGVGTNRDLRLTAHVGELDADRSAALAALLPDLAADPAFAVTFPKGQIAFSATRMQVAGLDGRDLVARGSWDGGVLVVDEVSAGDLGGAQFSAALTAFGSILKPELSGTADIAIGSADAPALTQLYATLGTSDAVAAFLAPSLPAELKLTLDAPNGDGAQSLKLSGTTGGSDVSAEAQLQAGFLRALGGALQVRMDVRADDAVALARQIGFAGNDLFAGGTPGHLVVQVDGDIANSLKATLRLSSGADSLGFAGDVVVTNPESFSGRGTLKLALADASALADLAGVAGMALPPLSGSATVVFDGADDIALEAIEGRSGESSFKGRLQLDRGAEGAEVAGAIELDSVDVAGLAGALGGPAALLRGNGLWPDGPLASVGTARSSSGRIQVTAPVLTAAGEPIGTAVGFDFDWDATNTRLREGRLTIGAGDARFDLNICCAGPLPMRQVTGRYALNGVALDDIVPPAVAEALDGTLTASGRIDGTGDSFAGLLAAMTGDGTFEVRDLEVERFDPAATSAIAGLENILEMQPEEVIGAIEDGLDDGPFVSPLAAGTFAIAGGVVRSPNLAIEGTGGRLFGSASIRLADLGLSGSYNMTPVAADGEVASGQVVARLGGTLLAPDGQFDVSAMVDAVMVEAYEAEVARLEQLRAEDEARQKAAAEEAARLAAEEAARRAEEEAAARAAAEEAARLAAEEEARRAAAEAAAAEADRPVDIGFGN
jgi:hypothetical protein